MSTALTKKNDEQSIAATYTTEQLDLIKNTVAKECTNDELQLFLYRAAKAGLDPLAKQIYAIKRWDSKLGKKIMTIQTGIDGFRTIADSTSKYAPGRETIFKYDDKNKLLSATTFVKKYVQGEWHESPQIAFWDEFCPKEDFFWKKMPHGQIEKCSEAKNLRKCFPENLSGMYINEEMQQADTEPLKTIKMGDQPEKQSAQKSPPVQEAEQEEVKAESEKRDAGAAETSSPSTDREKTEEVMFEGQTFLTAGISESFAGIVIFQRKSKGNQKLLITYLNSLGLNRVSDLTEQEAKIFLAELEVKAAYTRLCQEPEAQPEEQPDDEKTERDRLRKIFYAKVAEAGFKDDIEKVKSLCKKMFQFKSFSDCPPDKIDFAITFLDRYFENEKGKAALKVTLDSLKEGD